MSHEILRIPSREHHLYQLTPASAQAIIALADAIGIGPYRKLDAARGVIANIAEVKRQIAQENQYTASKRRLNQAGKTKTLPISAYSNIIFAQPSETSPINLSPEILNFCGPCDGFIPCSECNDGRQKYATEYGFCVNARINGAYGTMTQEGFQRD